MRLSPKSTKLSAVAVTLITSLTLLGATGCDNTANTEATPEAIELTSTEVTGTEATDTVTPAVIETPATPTTTAPLTQNTPSTSTSNTTIVQLLSDGLDNVVYTPMINSGDLTEEQITCLEARDKTVVVDNVQTFYEQNFTPDELNQLNGFYNSPAGKRMSEYGSQQRQAITGETLSPMVPLTEAEITEIKAFAQSPLGQKFEQLNLGEGEGSLSAAVDPIILSEFKNCGIDAPS